MKVAIIFYSFSGNTKQACNSFCQLLQQKGSVTDMIELKPQKEVTSFLRQCLQALFKQTPPLAKSWFSADAYDVIICASPVWAFTIAPALRSFFKTFESLSKKKAACFVTYHSGVGADKALNELRNILKEKGARVCFSAKLAGEKTNDSRFLHDSFTPLLESMFC